MIKHATSRVIIFFIKHFSNPGQAGTNLAIVNLAIWRS
jgi:hypothetical protein